MPPSSLPLPPLDRPSSCSSPVLRQSAAPPLLQRLYGAENVLTLRELLVKLSRDSYTAKELSSRISRPMDHPEYAHGLLENTFCVVGHAGPKLEEKISLQQSQDTSDVIERSIQLIESSGPKQRNLICKGHQSRSMARRQAQSAFGGNTLVDRLLSPPWKLLHSRIGDTLMLYLLLHVSMFVSLPNGCCFQLTGLPAASVARDWKRHEAEKKALAVVCGSNDVNKDSEESGVTDKRCKTTTNVRLHTDEDLQADTSRCSRRNLPQHSNAVMPMPKAAPVEGEDGNTTRGLESNIQASTPPISPAPSIQCDKPWRKRRCSRPSSWQRKKMRKDQRNDGVHLFADSDQTSKHIKESITPTADAASVSELQPAIAVSRNDAVKGKGTEVRARMVRDRTSEKKPKSARVLSQWPRYMPKPMEMVIPRSPVFYSSTFSCRAGFPRRQFSSPSCGSVLADILYKLKGKGKAPRILYNAIFNSRLNPLGRFRGMGRASHLWMPKPARRVPPQDRHLLGLLEALIRRVSKCPFGILLNAYCPLPRALRNWKKAPDAPATTDAPAGASVDDEPGLKKPTASSVGDAAARSKETISQFRKPSEELASVLDEIFELERNIYTGLDCEQFQSTSNRHAPEKAFEPKPDAVDLAVGVATGRDLSKRNGSCDGVAKEGGGAMVMRRRIRQTGLGDLVLTAGSQIHPTVSFGLLPERMTSKGRPTDKEAEDIGVTSIHKTNPQDSKTLVTMDEKDEKMGKDHHGKEIESGGVAIEADDRRESCECQLVASTSNTKRKGVNTDEMMALKGISSCDMEIDCARDDGGREQTVLGHGRQKGHEKDRERHTNDGKSSSARHDTVHLAACFVPHAQVSGFVWAVVRRCIPSALLGNARCQRALQFAIRKFVSLRRYEDMTVHQVMQGQKMKNLHWLYPSGRLDASQGIPPNRMSAQQRRLALWLAWLFSSFIVPLLRAHFFCTESEAYRQQVFYYRKQVWNKLKSSQIDQVCGTQFAPISDDLAHQVLSSRRIGVSRLRMIPKRTGMRFIVNMGSKSTARFRFSKRSSGSTAVFLPRRTVELKFDSVNSHLRDIHKILKFEVSRQPKAFGTSVFGYNDAYCYLQPFIRRWRAAAAAAMVRRAAGPGQDARRLSTDSANIHSKTNHTAGPGCCRFLTSSQRMEASCRPEGMCPLIVSVDISRAFDHVDVNLLLDLVSKVFISEEYLIVKYSEIFSSMNAVRVIPKSFAIPLHGHSSFYAGFPHQAGQWANSQRNKLFVDSVTYVRISREKALSVLRQHLTANIVRLRRKWHYQCRGIAQGSTLSTLLCCIYLAHVERMCLDPVIGSTPMQRCHPPSVPRAEQGRHDHGCSVLQRSNLMQGRMASEAMDNDPGTNVTSSNASSQSKPMAPPHTILLRQVDDWLLITNQFIIATDVAKRLLQGMPAYNIAVNPNKTKLSFDLNVPGIGPVPPSLYQAADGSAFVKWCGLLINRKSLEIQGDYTRYSGEHISTTLTLPARKSPGASLAIKLCYYLRPKAHPLLLDSRINSQRTIQINVYQNFALSAMKFHCHVREAFASHPSPTSTVLYAAIDTGIKFMIKMTRPRRVAPAHRPEASLECDPQIPSIHVRYLGLHAFKTILEKKQTLYGPLLEALDASLSAPACGRCSKVLEEAVDPVHHSVLDSILY